ncbi:MAG: 4Fe-4S dicluster domain-containing protein [Gemmatimonadales bacterium]|jgi:ferredoxin
MAHHTVKSGYSQLADRLNRFPQGAPPTALLFSILGMLFSEREAGLVASLPIKPFTVKRASEIWKTDLAEAHTLLDRLADRGILVDVEDRHGTSWYTLPPPMAGFFEFSMMRVREDVDQKVLSELFYQYLNVEEDFIRALFTRGETQLGRAFVHEPALSEENALHVLDYERSSEVVATASHRAVGMCYCRHKMQHLGRACDAPMDICMTFNATAQSLIKHGIAREVDAAEGMDLLHQAWDRNLVQFGENVQRRVNFICNCCGCCCEAMIAARRFAILNPVHTTNFLPAIRRENCNGCGKCVNVCPVEAMTLVSANDPRRPRSKTARLAEDRCLGCGLCVRSCGHDAVALRSRPERVLTPVDGVHRVLMMAVERGTLQDLIFDNRTLWNHRAMAAVLGAILKLPPIKQALANRQMRSRYVDALLARVPR